MTEDTMNEQIRICDAEVTRDGSRLAVCVNEQDQEYMTFLKTLDGIEFGLITFDGNEEFGASFLYSTENCEKVDDAGYMMMITGRPFRFCIVRIETIHHNQNIYAAEVF